MDFFFDGDVDVDDFACEDPAFLGGGAGEVGVVFEGDLVVGFAGLVLFGFGEFGGGFDLDFDPVFGGPAFVFDVGGLDLGGFLDIDVDFADIDEFFLACGGGGSRPEIKSRPDKGRPFFEGLVRQRLWPCMPPPRRFML